ncbi:alpha/beta hydrolase-fold protein [Saccharicrinis sp. 156]|uniref:carboxylesterase family protein n=1 Tax=Saccharicrinis sp. 156 TaxID=3417574 RepID=UPI003D328438
MKLIKHLYLLVFLPLLSLQGQTKNGYVKKEFILKQDTLKYCILHPREMKSGKKYPLVLFLHGAGERGNDNHKQLTHGSTLFLNEKNRKKYPAIVLFPQCPNGIMWTHRLKEKSDIGVWEFEFPLKSGPTKPAFLVNELVEQLLTPGKVDERRVYIMGLSMGGIGTLDFLSRWPDKYAAAQVICGGHDPALVDKYKHVPIWFFHGDKDDVVPPKYAQQVYKAHKQLNPQTKFTMYPHANHNSWDPAFAEPDYLKWIFKLKKR